MIETSERQENIKMKKLRLLGVLLAGIISVTGVPYIAQPLTTVAYAEDKLPAPKVKADYVSSEYVRLSWEPVKGADAYRVLRYNSKSGKYVAFAETMATDCHVSGLSPKTVYRFKVVALKTSGKNSTEQTRSDEIKVTTKGIEAPSSIYVSVKSDSVTLKWNSSYQAAAYRIYKYNSKKGKFVKYKDVKTTQCTIDGLAEGKTYKFRIASLAKSGEKYSVQEKSPVITASPVKGEEFSIPDFPKYGITSTDALKVMGATNYTIVDYEYGGTMYTISGDQVFALGMSANSTGLLINDKDEYYGVTLMRQTTASNKEVLNAFRKKNGEPKLVKDHSTDMYIWDTKDELKLATFESGFVVYAEVSKKYAPQELLKELYEAMKKTESASAEV